MKRMDPKRFAMSMMSMVACALSAGWGAGCASNPTTSYLVSVRDRVTGQAVEGATVEVRDGVSGGAPRAGGTTDGRGELVLVVPAKAGGAGGADLFVTFDGESDRYWFPPNRTPSFDAPKAEIDGDQSTLRFVTGASAMPAWKVTLVKIAQVVR
jgi:hypothetical protein